MEKKPILTLDKELSDSLTEKVFELAVEIARVAKEIDERMGKKYGKSNICTFAVTYYQLLVLSVVDSLGNRHIARPMGGKYCYNPQPIYS